MKSFAEGARNGLMALIGITFFWWQQLTPAVIVVAIIFNLFMLPRNLSIQVIVAQIKQPIVWIFSAFFLLHLASMLYTENTAAGWRGLELKASFLLVPILIPMLFQQEGENKKRFLFWLKIAGLTYGLFCLSRAGYNYWQEGNSTLLFSDQYAWRMHPSYLSVYFVFLLNAEVLLWMKERKEVTSGANLLHGATIVAFLVFTLFTTAKVGLVLLVLSAIWFTILWIRQTKSWKKPVLLFSAIILVCGAAVWLTPLKLRLEQMVEELLHPRTDPDKYVQSTGMRIWAWRATENLVDENTWTGVGVGDIRDDLNYQYRIMGIPRLADKHLDTHQQFFQTWATVGIFGLLLLVVLFLWLLVLAWRRNNYLLLYLTLLFIVFGITESMFERQAGVLFFTFVSGVLLCMPAQPKQQING